MIFVDFFVSLLSMCLLVPWLFGQVFFVPFIVTRYVACYVQCYFRSISKRWLTEAVLTMNYFFRCSNIYPTRCNVTQFILSENCCTCFEWYLHPLSGAHTTASTSSVICHTVTAICRYRGRYRTGLSVLWVA
jgi:hypothetical protein